MISKTFPGPISQPFILGRVENLRGNIWGA